MKKSVSPKNFGAIVGSSPTLRLLRQQAKNLQRIEEFIALILDPEIAKRISVGTMGEDYLVIIVDSSAWASRIRYMLPVLLDHFSQHQQYRSIKSIRIRTLKQDVGEAYAVPKRRLKISDDAQRNIESMAKSMAGSEIGDALQRLVDSAKGKPDK